MPDHADFGYVIDHSIWLSPAEAAKHFSCRKQTLYNKKSQGEIPVEFILTAGHLWYIHKDTPLVIKKTGRPKKVALKTSILRA